MSSMAGPHEPGPDAEAAIREYRRVAVEEAEIEAAADAALFSFTHDVLQSPGAIANVVRHLRPGGRVASTDRSWPGSQDLTANG